jgi:Peptidase family M28
MLPFAFTLLAAGALAAQPHAAGPLLSQFATDRSPYLHLEANSDQRQPLYLGITPRELERGLPVPLRPRLWQSLQARGERQLAEVVRRALGAEAAAEVEAWPVQDDGGQLTWAIARVRSGPREAWRWLSDSLLEKWPQEGTAPPPILPTHLSPARPAEATQLFTDVLERASLYSKPVFGDCVWVEPRSGEPMVAWMPTAERLNARKVFSRGENRADCRAIPQPPRLGHAPLTFVLAVAPAKQRPVEWPEEIEWVPEPTAPPPLAPQPALVTAFPETFQKSFVADLEVLTGRTEVRFRDAFGSEQRLRFEKRSSAQEGHQLELLADWLESRYRALGLQTHRRRFIWHGLPQSNVWAVLPATAEPRDPRPVLLADHYDTAFCEDAFARTSRRVAAPGADDDGSGTATLLRAAALLSAADAPPRHHDLWLLHLTGEEFPADDLGARMFVSESLAERRDYAGMVLLDMIGWSGARDGVFQVSPGPSAESLQLAALALDAARVHAPALQAALRPRFDDRSYLYNTDGLIVADAGYPVVLLNEHINRLENRDRQGYHQTTDTLENLDPAYAAQVAKVAIETAARLAR